MSAYDPADDLMTLLENALADEQDVKIYKEWEIRDLDLLSGDYVLIRSISEEDEYLGIGGMEFMRHVVASVMIRTAESRERVRELEEKIRAYFRTKANWVVNGRTLLNLYVTTGDLTRTERGIWTQEIEVFWFTIEVVA